MEYIPMLVYKLIILCTGKTALFESHVDAEKYVELMNKSGHNVELMPWGYDAIVEK